MYVSRAGVKDFGDRVRIDAYIYDENAASAAAEIAKANAGGAAGRRRGPAQ